jgi:dTDP-4-dehydrorhamnose 3,5-epimerase-like enzyme
MNLKEKIKIIPRKKLKDHRGWFLKAIDGTEDNLPDYTGEIYLTSAVKGEARGNHYHAEATEWFTLIDGKATLILEDVNTKERMELSLDSENPVTIVIPPFVAHVFVNFNSKPFILLAYTDKLYDPKDTIRYELYKNGK